MPVAREVPGEEALALWAGVQGLAALVSRRTTDAVGTLDADRALALLLDRALT
ncbi:MAG: hypothetical protein FWE71_08935 [Nocardioidaceae bacterium]|nr:hypothetical protein [Nocardioidaceae bacterium]MCL2612489.1 hypothetical protein [Nocardioidaceae bacterium]